MLFFTERKASKELQAYRLTVRAAGSGSMAAMKDGVHARGASRDPSTAAPILNIVPEGAHTARALRLRARSFQSHRASARRMTESARRCAVPSVGSRGYALASSTMRVRDSVSMSLLVLFSSGRKAHIFSFGTEKPHAFLCRKKSIKRTASLRLDR